MKNMTKLRAVTVLAFSILTSVLLAQSSDPVSVTDFGAGTGNPAADTTAIQGAINTGKDVYFPPNKYFVTSTLHLRSNRTYSGANLHASSIVYTGAGSAFSLDGQAGITIRSLEINGSNQGGVYGNSTGIDFGSADGSSVDDVAMSFFEGDSCIRLTGTRNTVRNSNLQYCKYGILMGGDRNVASHNYISSHYSTSNHQDWDGICAEGLTNSLIDGNTVEDNGQSGIYIGGNNSVSYGDRVVNNYAYHNYNRGIDLGVSGNPSSTQSLSRLVVSGNTVIDNKEANIWLDYVQGAAVAGNDAEYTSDYPIFFGTSANPNRVSVALAEYSGTDPGVAKTSLVTLTGNTITDYQGSTKLCLSYQISAGVNNVVGPNAMNCYLYTPPDFNGTANKLY